MNLSKDRINKALMARYEWQIPTGCRPEFRLTVQKGHRLVLGPGYLRSAGLYPGNHVKVRVSRGKIILELCKDSEGDRKDDLLKS